MPICINPSCPRPHDPNNDNQRFCQSCGSDLVLQGRYRVMRLLSDKSGFGKIYEVYEGSTPKILKVLKENLNHDAKAVELFKQEAVVLGQLSHPSIPQVDGYFEYQSRNNLPLHCLVMEKIEGPTLEEWLQQQENRPISQAQAIAWLKQLAIILQLIHDRQYLHRDIKPSNIMLRPDGQLVLIDFGTAREVTRTYLAKLGAGQGITAIISSGYTAPEQMNGEAVKQSDFFALGRTFVFLLTGRQPMTMYDAQQDALNWRGYTTGIAPSLLNLIDELMARNPSDRPSDAREILQRLEEMEGDGAQTFTETVKVGGSPIPASCPPQEEPHRKWYIIAVLGTLLGLVLIGMIGLAVSNPEFIWVFTPAQAPQKKGEVDYFPYVEGTDSQGRTAEFSVAVLSREYKWKIGSSYQVRYNDRLIPIDELKSNLEDEGIQRIMDNPSEIISVGTASCEGAAGAEERRALERAKQIQLLGKRLFRDVPSVQDYRLLNLGQFIGDDCQADQDSTSYQRSIIIIGVKNKTEGVILDEALRSRLEDTPFGDFRLEDYSLGSPAEFQTIPSQLEG
ncbi:serine/threonine protein kinase [Coleofasciculus sp. LEGE 07081]|uniref:serine/threonine protein kinase n=1 Tax=unclassified Coleofasciculus TaxID=2692782 RepID=UPI00187ED48C|nr:serine/threonine protein kinase [Coleofasciculus sp. LEGE 07081]MBE9149950.1 serine/threonine protein kinase [Coleofasciculus sp. LEGE 07092]